MISITVILTLLSGCSSQNTIEEALGKVNVKVDKIYFVDNFDNITIAFYKEKVSEQKNIGIFFKEKERYTFISQQDLQSSLNNNEDITFNAFLHDKTKDIPEFSFQFGLINKPQIENVNLHMAGEQRVDDRYAEITKIEGLRVWYTYLDTKRIFNIQQGLSKDGKVIFSNSKAYN